MDESPSPAQCSAIAQLQVSIKRVLTFKSHWAMFMRHKKWAAMYAGMRAGQYWLPVSKWESWTTLADVLHVLMLTRTKWRRHCWHQWWWRCRLTHIPWQAMVSLINKRVGKNDSVALTSGRYVITGTFRLWQLPVLVHVKLVVYFFLSSTSVLLTWIRLELRSL